MSQSPASGELHPERPVLVDTSIWIAFFRNAHSLERQAVDQLLSSESVVTCDPVRVEVISGAPNRLAFERLRTLFGALRCLPLPDRCWDLIEERRFALIRSGHHPSLVDLLIAVTANAHQVALWTKDRDFNRIATVIPLTLFDPHPVLS